MKTKIRTFITVCTLAFVGVLNANAAANFEEKNSGLNRTNESLTILNEKTTSFESELNRSVDYGKEAQLMIKQIADNEEVKAVQNVMDKGFIAPVETFNSSENEFVNENINETTDFLKEARLMTKLIADKEEAKAIQNVMEKGFVTPNETNNSFENKGTDENIDVTTDFLKEARTMTRLIADKEEAKAFQNIMKRGYIVPSETINSFENEIANETNDAIIDFGKEAKLLIKLIADKEEAKTVQKLIAEGKLEKNN